MALGAKLGGGSLDGKGVTARRYVTDRTLAALERGMLVGSEQFRQRCRVRVVAGGAVGSADIVALVSRAEGLILVVTVETPGRHLRGKQPLVGAAVGGVAGKTLTILDRSMDGFLVYPLQNLRMTRRAQRGWFLGKHPGEIRGVRLVALHAFTGRRRLVRGRHGDLVTDVVVTRQAEIGLLVGQQSGVFGRVWIVTVAALARLERSMNMSLAAKFLDVDVALVADGRFVNGGDLRGNRGRDEGKPGKHYADSLTHDYLPSLALSGVWWQTSHAPVENGSWD